MVVIIAQLTLAMLEAHFTVQCTMSGIDLIAKKTGLPSTPQIGYTP